MDITTQSNLKLGAIDIGSNAARLLMSQVYEHEEPYFKKISLVRVPLRLGFDVFEHGYIPEIKIEKLVDTMKAYKLLMKVHDITAYKAYATSAMRDAQNSKELVKLVKQECQIDIEVIPGAKEAEILYAFHLERVLADAHDYLYIDVGGGSTEITLFRNKEVVASRSFNIGTIRMLTRTSKELEWSALKEWLKTHTKGKGNIQAIGSGGNINKLFKLSATPVGQPLAFEVLHNQYRQLKGLSLSERIEQYGMREDRADVIVPAAKIFTTVMKHAGVQHINVPKFGLSDAMIRELYEKELQKA